MKPSYYITTPIYYVNGAPHIGHAYTSIAADVMARFKRLDGFDVFFLTGTDEHGQKVEQAARAANLDPQAYVDGISADFQDMTRAMGVSNDDWIRTSEPRHEASSQELWRRIAASGDIYLDHYEGWYAVRDEAFYDEDELTDTPAGKIAPSGAPVEWVREPNFFFRLSAWQDRLLKFYEDQPDFIAPTSRRNEVISFVRGGLRDLPISRTTFTWGIPVPDAPGHVMYVWLDALQNYVTACGFPDPDAPRWRFWPADVHFVGKDIIRFHAVYWPAFLMAAGLPVPKRVTSNGWWVVDGEKMSKSLGNVIEPRKLVELFGLDQIRYFLMREKPFGADGSISHAAIVSRINVELANDLGNLAQRSLSLIARNLGGVLPGRGPDTAEDIALFTAAEALPDLLRVSMERQTFHEGLEDIWKVIRAANAYIDHQAPWALSRTDKARMSAVLRLLVDVLRTIATLLQPFMPTAMATMLDQLGVPPHARDIAALNAPLADAIHLPAPHGVFPRYVEPAGEVSRRMLIDSHCHLDSFAPEELPLVLRRAHAAGIGEMVTIGVTLAQSATLPAIAEAYPNLWCTVGVHPHHAAEAPIPSPERLAAMASHPRVIGIGESGLDYFYDRSPRDVQAENFRANIRAARMAGVPLAIHARDADDDVAAILRDETDRGGRFAFLLHCFSSTRALAEAALDLGGFISFSGILTFPRSGELRDIARDVPLDRLLVETDAPYLAPVPFRGKRNEPAYVAHTAKVLAELRGLSPEAVAELTTANFRRLFPKTACG